MVCYAPLHQAYRETALYLQIISVFQVFYEPMMMTAGGPDNASISLMYLCYKYTFLDNNAGAGAACGVILAIIIMLLSFLYFKLSKKEETV